MTDQYIASKLYKSETFRVGNYLIPKFITSKEGNKLGLERIRKNYLKNVNPGMEVFKEEFKDLHFIQELPIPMLDSFLCYRCFDIFLPNHGVAIELDSHFHDETEEKDFRSDQYVLRRYGIKVIRVRLASEVTKEKDLKLLRETIPKLKDYGCPWPIDFSDILAHEYKEKHKKEFLEIEKLEKQFSVGLYNGNMVISLSQEKLLKSVLKTLEIKYTVF